MHTKFFPWLSLFGLFATLTIQAFAQAVATPAAAGEARLGQIRATRVVGRVMAEDIATKAIQPLTNNQVIQQGTIVRTEPDSSVVLIFSNGASISLAHTSELNIETFTQNSFEGNFEPATATDEPSVSVTSIKLNRGELVGNVKKLRTTSGSKFTVGTPVGAAGIRGTTFRIVYRPTGNGLAFTFSLTTVEGSVELATGTANAPGVFVNNSQEVVMNNVTVDPTTNVVSFTNAAGVVVPVFTLPPTVEAAPVAVIQQIQASAQVIAQAVANVVFVAPPPATTAPKPETNSTDTQKQEPKKEEKKEASSPGLTESANRITTP